MKVCVFGGAGFIGSRVAKCLLQAGHNVVIPLRHPERGLKLEKLGAVVIPGDLNNRDDIRKAISGSNVVINLAVPSYKGRAGLGRVQAIARQFKNYVSAIIEESQRGGDIPVIISEGTFIWGDSGEGWHDETSAFRPLGMGRIGQFSTPYVQRLMEEKKSPIIRIIAAATYGATGWFEYAMYDLMEKGWYRTFGNGQNIMSFVYIDDVAEAYRLAVENLPIGESFAIADDYPVKMRDFANCLAHAIHKPVVKPMPKWLGNLMAGKVWVEELTMTHRVKNTKAKEQLGWQPKYHSYELGIPEAVREINKSRES